jgi:hypothetical protein
MGRILTRILNFLKNEGPSCKTLEAESSGAKRNRKGAKLALAIFAIAILMVLIGGAFPTIPQYGGRCSPNFV